MHAPLSFAFFPSSHASHITGSHVDMPVVIQPKPGSAGTSHQTAAADGWTLLDKTSGCDSHREHGRRGRVRRYRRPVRLADGVCLVAGRRRETVVFHRGAGSRNAATL